ncbi:unnamed protein product [Brassicogethes aeneus]|uniref:Uncharacterized protein n=1 Tax=Brassicogethes aeneus TaxID=1431903 RepID=A0A9P0AXU6_BRAAE|nr:unnamed protein product [Brassicogethes aeneus]
MSKDKRGKHAKTPQSDRELMKKHVESFGPTISHYQRAHAPNKKYLPSDITIIDMHKDFIAKIPGIKCSYYTETFEACLSESRLKNGGRVGCQSALAKNARPPCGSQLIEEVADRSPPSHKGAGVEPGENGELGSGNLLMGAVGPFVRLRSAL